MFQTKIIFILSLAASKIEFSIQQRTTDDKFFLKNDDVGEAKIREELLAAIRRGDMNGFREIKDTKGLKGYAYLLKNNSEPRLKELENAVEYRMQTIQFLINTRLAVPASKDQPQQYHFNVTLVPGTEAIAQLSLNLDALKNWESYKGPLHAICSVPDMEPRIVKYLLDKGLDIHEKAALSLLDLAAFNGNFALVKFLIENGADMNLTIRKDVTGFGSRNYHSFIRLLTPNALAVRNGTKAYRNALTSAIFGGNKEIVKYLISMGMDVNLDNQSFVLLFEPVYDGKREIVEVLLKSGCDVNKRDWTGATALHIAAAKEDSEMVELLLNNGANVSVFDNFGWTPLHVAAYSSRNIAMVKLLLKYGALIEAKTNSGFTPLMLAVVGHNPSFLDCLREAITINFSKSVLCLLEPDTSTPRIQLEIISLLCNKGANVESKDDVLGWSALHWASARGDEKAASLLVEKCGATNLTRSKAGISPSDVAKYIRLH